MNPHQDRRAPRVSMSGEAVVEFAGHSLRVPTVDLSEGGLAVWAPKRGTNAPVRITMALEGQPVILKGRVARTFESEDGALWGIEFLAGSDETSLQIVSDAVAQSAR